MDLEENLQYMTPLKIQKPEVKQKLHTCHFYIVIGFVLLAKVMYLTGRCESSVTKTLRGIKIIGYKGYLVLSAEDLLTVSGKMPWSQRGKMSTKSILSECETSCMAKKIEVTGWKKVSVYLITSELEPSSYNGIHVTKSPPKSSAGLFMVFIDECEDFATYNQSLIYQSFLFSAPCLSFLADLLAAALVSCLTWFQAPQHTC